MVSSTQGGRDRSSGTDGPIDSGRPRPLVVVNIEVVVISTQDGGHEGVTASSQDGVARGLSDSNDKANGASQRGGHGDGCCSGWVVASGIQADAVALQLRWRLRGGRVRSNLVDTTVGVAGYRREAEQGIGNVNLSALNANISTESRESQMVAKAIHELEEWVIVSRDHHTAPALVDVDGVVGEGLLVVALPDFRGQTTIKNPVE